MAVHVALERP